VSASSLEVASVPYALASTHPFGGTLATYAFYGTGCLGMIGGGGPFCRRANDDMTLASFQGVPANYAILVNSGSSGISVTGFQLWTRTVSGSPATTNTWLYDRAASGEPGAILVRGTMNVTGTPAWQQTTFPAVVIPPNTDFFLAYDNRANLVNPIAAAGRNLTHYYAGPPTWLGPFTVQPWNYRLVCTTTGAVPLLGHTNLPNIGGTFSLDLALARASAPAVLLFGFSRTSVNLGGIGAPLCHLLTSPDILFVTGTDSAGSASLAFPVPNQLSLVNGMFQNQFAVYDPSANVLGWAFSRGGEATIGIY
jgi:hypothetical protein